MLTGASKSSCDVSETTLVIWISGSRDFFLQLLLDLRLLLGSNLSREILSRRRPVELSVVADLIDNGRVKHELFLLEIFEDAGNRFRVLFQESDPRQTPQQQEDHNMRGQTDHPGWNLMDTRHGTSRFVIEFSLRNTVQSEIFQ